MSIALMTKVWQAELPSATHKLILLAFADKANDEGVCWPRVDVIAVRSGLSVRQTQRIMADLKEAGVLEVAAKSIRWGSPTYRVRGDKLTPLRDLGVTPTSFRGDIHDTLGVTSTSPLSTLSKESSVEPSLNIKGDNFFEARYKRAKG